MEQPRITNQGIHAQNVNFAIANLAFFCFKVTNNITKVDMYMNIKVLNTN